MDIGIVLGAMLAAALAGRYAPVWRVPLRSLIAAVVGGLLLGYGARLAYGCNIGAYFSGIVSGSLHGWLGWSRPFSATWSARACAGVRARSRARETDGLLIGPASASRIGDSADTILPKAGFKSSSRLSLNRAAAQKLTAHDGAMYQTADIGSAVHLTNPVTTN